MTGFGMEDNLQLASLDLCVVCGDRASGEDAFICKDSLTPLAQVLATSITSFLLNITTDRSSLWSYQLRRLQGILQAFYP